jgi:hypothetical protein
LYTLCCQFLWIVLFWLLLSVFSNVYLSCVPYVASFSGLSFFDCYFRYSLTFIYLVYPMLPVSGFSFFDCHFRYSLTFIYLVYPMLPVSLDFPFLIATFGILYRLFILCTLCCQFLWIVLFWLPLSVFSNVYLSCVPYVASFWIFLFWLPLSVFSNVYLSCVPYVASFSGLPIFDCPFGML